MSYNWQEEYRSKTDSELYKIMKFSSYHSRIMRKFAEEELENREFNFKHIEKRFKRMNGKSILARIKYIETYGNNKWPAWKIFLFFGPGCILVLMALNGFNLSILDLAPVMIVIAIFAMLLSGIVNWLMTRKLMKLYEKFDEIVN